MGNTLEYMLLMDNLFSNVEQKCIWKIYMQKLFFLYFCKNILDFNWQIVQTKTTKEINFFYVSDPSKFKSQISDNNKTNIHVRYKNKEKRAEKRKPKEI